MQKFEGSNPCIPLQAEPSAAFGHHLSVSSYPQAISPETIGDVNGAPPVVVPTA